MISNVFHPVVGGVSSHIFRLSRALRAAGVDVIVVTRRFGNTQSYEVVQGVPTFRVGYGDGNKIVAALSFIAGAVRVLQRERARYQVLHAHVMLSSTDIGLLMHGLSGKPLIINPHGSGLVGDVAQLSKRPIAGRIRLAATRQWSAAFVCISPDIRAELRANGIDNKKMWDIVNGVDTALFCPADDEQKSFNRRNLNLPIGPMVIYTGRLVALKGVQVLLQSWPLVLQRAPNAHLLIVGDGDQRPVLESQTQQLGLTERVTFLGNRDSVVNYLQSADAFVLPSYSEGLPVSLLEALSCGLPSVVTGIEANRRVITDGATGRLVPVGNPVDLAEGLVAALIAPEAQQWAARARQHIVENYSLEKTVEQHIELYQALSQPGPVLGKQRFNADTYSHFAHH